MDFLIRFLNDFGATWNAQAWSMAWQASLVFAALWVANRLLAGRVRATVRCALWCLLPVKLVLPAGLAFPTSPAWWLPSRALSTRSEHAMGVPVVRPAVDTSLVIRIGGFANAASSVSERMDGDGDRAVPRLDIHGWALLAWMGGWVGLLLLMFHRARWLRAVLARAERPPEEVLALATRLAREIGLREVPRLAMSAEVGGPAVCGLWRPTVLVPPELVERLTPGQLEHVLLHELLHVKRGDLVWSHLQSLLLVAYWPNLVLWLADVRIRRVREEATDEAVAVVRRGSVLEYAETLLSVARWTGGRRLVRLGLVGILEPGNALSARVRSLVTRPVPTRSGVGWRAWMAVVACGLTLLPLARGRGERPQGTAGNAATAATASNSTGAVGLGAETSAVASRTSIPPVVVVEDRYSVQPAGAPRLKTETVPGLPSADTPPRGLSFDLAGREGGPTWNGPLSGGETSFVARLITGGGEADGTSGGGVPAATLTDATYTFHIPADVPRDEEGLRRWVEGLRTVLVAHRSRTGWDSVTLEADARAPHRAVAAAVGAARSAGFFRVQITGGGAEAEVLRGDAVDSRILGRPGIGELVTRVYRLNPRSLDASLSAIGFPEAKDGGLSARLIGLLEAVGFPRGGSNAVYFNQSKGLLMVRSSEANQELVGTALDALDDQNPAQYQIESRFLLVPPDLVMPAGRELFRDERESAHLLSSHEVEAFREALRRAGSLVEELAAPRVTTLDGRQAQVGVLPGPRSVPGSPGTEPDDPRLVRFGTVVVSGSGATSVPGAGTFLDVLPVRLAAEKRLELFLGVTHRRDDPAGGGTAASGGLVYLDASSSRWARYEVGPGESMLLRVRLRRVRAAAGELATVEPLSGAEARDLVVLISATQIDPAGNPVP